MLYLQFEFHKEGEVFMCEKGGWPWGGYTGYMFNYMYYVRWIKKYLFGEINFLTRTKN